MPLTAPMQLPLSVHSVRIPLSVPSHVTTKTAKRIKIQRRNFIHKPYRFRMDLNGIDLTPVQDTPVASRKEDTYDHFNVDIEIQKHMKKISKGAAIFFELKHYKPKLRFTSTQCFPFMEMDEIKPGTIGIQLYRKPTDPKRKKLQLLAKKPLYLHQHQTLHKE